ncbi:Txe/YoeB family addiction module toxin [Desulfocastanea catecholica]
MATWEIVFTKQAQKDAKKQATAGLKAKAQRLLEIIRKDPFQNPPPCERLIGDLAGVYSRRINTLYRLISDTVVYRSKMSHGGNKRNFEMFAPLEFIAAITQHIPERLAQMVRYYGWYSNRMWGDRQRSELLQGGVGENGIAKQRGNYHKQFPHEENPASGLA